MREEKPDLLTTNINCWLREKPETRLVRTLDNKVRAFLSDRFRPLDNWMVAEAALPTLLEKAHGGDLIIQSSEITEKRMYIQCSFPRLTDEVKVGDPVTAGLVLSNSEVGLGALNVEMLIWRLVCENGMIRQNSMRKYHVGKKVDSNDEVAIDFYRAETIEQDNKAFMMKVQDTVNHAFDELAFHEEVRKLRQATTEEIPVDKVDDTVKEVTKKFSFTENESSSILGNLIKGGDLSKWGLANAVTALGHDASDYDRCVEYEKAGGRIIDLTEREWSAVTKKAA
jgi:hypothetical protein